jgi:putative ABC transport system substrate-binding protein
MKRRAFIGALAGGLLAAPHAAPAQPARTVKIGWLAAEPKPFALDPFRQVLKEVGWVEGSNLAIEQRYSSGAADRYPQMAAEMVRLRVDVIVADGSPATRATQQATSTIPIVFVSSNAIQQGFAASLSHPGKNLTGVEIIGAGLNPKRLQFLKEAVPGMARLGVLEDRSGTGLAPSGLRLAGNREAIEVAARQLGMQLKPMLEVRTTEGLTGAFAQAVKEGAGGILVLPSSFFTTRIQRIVTLAARHRLPALYEHRAFVEAGGLMSYGPNRGDMFRRLAVYVDKILRGAKPADLPIEQPTKVELVINLKAAKALGLSLPPSVLARADEVIE